MTISCHLIDPASDGCGDDGHHLPYCGQDGHLLHRSGVHLLLLLHHHLGDRILHLARPHHGSTAGESGNKTS